MPAALRRIYSVKDRPSNHPVIVHVTGVASITDWARDVPDSAVKLAEAFWPGPLTLVVNRGELANHAVTGGQDTVALRAPAHPLFQRVLVELADMLDDPVGIAAPSANRFGQVSPTTAQHVADEIGSRLIVGRDVILDGGPCEVGVESTIVLCHVLSCQIAREGGITREQIGTLVNLADTGTESIRVPGSLESHYAPRARLMVVDRVPAATASAAPQTTGLIAPAYCPTPTGWVRLAAPTDASDYARVLYSALREGDDRGIELVVAVPPEPTGLGAAVRDRLRRAQSR